MGTTIGFVSKTPLYTRFFELGGISQDQPPLFFDQTNTIPEFIPQTVDSVIASPALSLVSMGTTGTPNMFCIGSCLKATNGLLVRGLDGSLLAISSSNSTI